MELTQAINMVLDLARQNMLNDPEMVEEMANQEDAIATLELFQQELQNPSPVQVVIECEGAVIYQVFSNVPTNITVLECDLEGAEDGSCRYIDVLIGNEYYIGSPDSIIDPTLVADIVKEAHA